MRIIFAGGGTLGSVTPLLALYEELRVHADREGFHPIDVRWIGTQRGVEYSVIALHNIPFYWIFSGKLRRYFDVRNFIDPILLCAGFIQSLIHLLLFRPDLIVSAGGYVSVPVLWAGWFLRLRSLIFQLDIQPSLSNILTTFCAQKIGVACEEERQYFPKAKTVVTGIPVRRFVYDARERTASHEWRAVQANALHLPLDMPIVLIMGGGTGADALNALVRHALPKLVQTCSIIHITGKGKNDSSFSHERYFHIEFAGPELLNYCALADLVITRGGMGSLAELSVLSKPSIIIPLPHSHQEFNAIYFERRQAAVYCAQNALTPELFSKKIKELLSDSERRAEIGKNMGSALPPDGSQRAADLVMRCYE